MSRLAIYATTVATAVQLARAARTPATTTQASSVGALALDFSSPELYVEIGRELAANNLLGDGLHQFPKTPWVLWDNDRVFRLLKSADVDEQASRLLRGITPMQLLEMSPATILALLGSPHRVVQPPRWLGQVAIGAGVGLGLVFLAQKVNTWRS